MFAASKTATPVSSASYQISRSLRFNSADNTYLTWTPASAGNRKTFTISLWAKRTAIGVNGALFSQDSSNSSLIDLIRFKSSDDLRVLLTLASGPVYGTYDTVAVFRDPSAWYHIVVAIDTTQATDTNRIKVYVNNVLQTFSGTPTYPSQNFDCLYFNNAISAFIGGYFSSAGLYDGNITEFNFIDGQALTPSSFGSTNAQTGVWGPKAYSGSYGTNGFYLNFSDNSNTTAATLGKDYSGNGNNFTPNNFSVSAGAGNDSLVDTPTNYGIDTGAGGEVRGNYTTMNPLDSYGANTFVNGNLDITIAAGAANLTTGTMAVSSGKWYWEITAISSGSNAYMIGVADAAYSASASQKNWQTATGWYYYGNGGYTYTNATSAAYGAGYTANDIIGVALNMDAGTITFYKNGSSQGVAFSVFAGKTIQPAIGSGTSLSATGYTANFGQRPFAYTAPSGYKALCTQNLPTPTVGATAATQASQFFAPITYTGTGAANNNVTVGFQPDFIWIKNRQTAGYQHFLFDSVRGISKFLYSNLTNAEYTDANALTAINSNGFTLGYTTNADTNNSGQALVSWNWKANGAGVTNTDGTITSTVSANTTSGFSVVTFTVPASGTATVGHGLGVAPSMMLVKPTSTTFQWDVYHASLGNSAYVVLNTTAAQVTGATTVWNATSPTSTVFSLGTAWSGSLPSAACVAYCFAEVKGYSKFGSYAGNGAGDGPFVYCGFRPKYVMIKSSSNVEEWHVHDAARDVYNVASADLYPNSSSAEVTTSNQLDILSNGFKLRSTNSGTNGSGYTFIFAAFAEFPFNYTLAR